MVLPWEEARAFLLHTAKPKTTQRPVAGAPAPCGLLEAVASRANLARALLNVVRNKGAPGVDGQTVEVVERDAPRLIGSLREALLRESYRPGEGSSPVGRRTSSRTPANPRGGPRRQTQ